MRTRTKQTVECTAGLQISEVALITRSLVQADDSLRGAPG